MGKRIEQIKQCPSCGERKSLIYFGVNKYKIDGRRNVCKDCNNKREDINLNKRIRRWRWGAKRRKIDWKISSSYINSMPKICFYTGIKLTIKRNQLNTLSLDRKDSSKGYIKSNVVFCCSKLNYMKSDMPIDEFIEWCLKVSRHKRKALR